MRGIIRLERLWSTECMARYKCFTTCKKYFTFKGREESEKMWQFAKGVGSEDHTSHILFYFFVTQIKSEFSLLLCCLTLCCDSRIQQIVNVTPLLTFTHVSSLMCCTCFQKEIQNYSTLHLKKVKDSEV